MCSAGPNQRALYQKSDRQHAVAKNLLTRSLGSGSGWLVLASRVSASPCDDTLGVFSCSNVGWQLCVIAELCFGLIFYMPNKSPCSQMADRECRLEHLESKRLHGPGLCFGRAQRLKSRVQAETVETKQ